jgi:hypothetical protein
MASEIASAMSAIAAVVGSTAGIRFATSQPKETQNVDPFAYVFMASGRFDVGPIGTRKSLTNIAIDVLKVRKDLPRDLATINPFLDSITLALLTEVSDTGDKFSNTISTFKQITLTLLPNVDYAGVQMIGYRFLMEDVKILVNL